MLTLAFVSEYHCVQPRRAAGVSEGRHTGLALALASSLFFWNKVDFYELLQPTNLSGMRELTD